MQILIQVVCSKGRSLRQEIVKDGKLDKYGLSVSEEKRPGRPHGWAKVHSTGYDRHGAINIEWDAKTNVLLCRVVTRGAGKPNQIIGWRGGDKGSVLKPPAYQKLEGPWIDGKSPSDTGSSE